MVLQAESAVRLASRDSWIRAGGPIQAVALSWDGLGTWGQTLVWMFGVLAWAGNTASPMTWGVIYKVAGARRLKRYVALVVAFETNPSGCQFLIATAAERMHIGAMRIYILQVLRACCAHSGLLGWALCAVIFTCALQY